ILYKMPVQIELAFLVISHRRREPRRHRCHKYPLPAFRLSVRLINYLDLSFYAPILYTLCRQKSSTLIPINLFVRFTFSSCRYGDRSFNKKQH
ncbi:MAG: hypothetical protein ACYS80_09395, partial [Planctomycetota bacterium]